MELDKFRDVDLVIDHVNKSFNFRPFVSQNDNDGRTLTVQVTDKGAIGEVVGTVMNLRWTNLASGLTDLSAFTLIDKKNTIFQMKYPKHMLNPGKVLASIQLIQNGQVSHSKQFEITVQQLAGEAKGIVQKAEYGALVEVLADSNKFRTDIDSLDIVKADKKEVAKVENMISKMPSATPKETFDNLAALKTKYPSGSTSAMVVLESDKKTGYIYLWSGSEWKKGALYQAQGIPDNSIENKKLAMESVTQEKTDFLHLEKNLLNPDRIITGAYVTHDSGIVFPDASYAYYPMLSVIPGQHLWIQSNITAGVRAFRKVTCYDSNMNLQSTKGWDNTSFDPSFFKIPNDTAFVTISFHTTYLVRPLMVCYSDSITTYSDYKEVLGEHVALGKQQLSLLEQSELDALNLIKDGTLRATKTAFYTINENIFEIGTQKDGCYMDPNGFEYENEGYYRTKKYPLKIGESISVVGRLNTAVHMRKVAVFDAEGSALDELGSDSQVHEGMISTYTAEDDRIAGIVISIARSSNSQQKGMEPENLMIAYGPVPEAFVDQLKIPTPDIGMSETQLRIIETSFDLEKTDLKGKKIVGTGDSISAGDGNKGVGFTEIVAQKMGLICKDYARGGATFCRDIQPTNNVVDQLLRAIQQESTPPDFLVTNG
ncbi:MAG: hypothetical protein ACLTXM_19680, partial [Enterococcus sp.]